MFSFLDHAVRSSLVDLLDKHLLIQLRDGSSYIGVLLSFDKFSNIVMSNAVQRKILFAQKLYHDSPIGLFVVKGDFIVIMGTYDARRNAAAMKSYRAVEKAEFDAVAAVVAAAQQKTREAMRQFGGIEGQTNEEDALM